MKRKNAKIGGIGLLAGAMLIGCTAGDRSSSSQSTITIGGSSEAYPILELLADAYDRKNVEIVFLPSSQSGGGLSGVRDNILDIGAISRPLSATEKIENLQYIPLVRNALVLIVNEQVKGVQNLNRNAVQEIFSGGITNWKEVGGIDGEIVILDLPEDETEKALLREHYLGQDLKITPQAILFEDDDDIGDAVSITPYSIGAIAYSEKIQDFSVQILTLDGIAPTAENIQNDQYKMVQTIGIVVSTSVKPTTEDFINFIATPEAQSILESNGYTLFKPES
ncbi:MAG: substrate-binding domain-containing protein [Roseofilum sp. SBFL]|uniref:substrate-binding domain-containing protein n=1 Tax=unclassified Roseofilum TaxID=2620099 RepID=UPI001B150FED|nr:MULTISPECIES: substrate-binding domain-containing protein [unclassified Roseofilum]MBP0014691.1 substrate-binding domain-containing protein [Roseofilum sp. SID3]MBP0024341.1 substrate-binding domain-containing protein [Roseofilum sp. SID2]MBP0038138.1 substrate-binding domain-containing protein [Roseofilum sp. SID1]MBP0043764.1 substrate-binding domain-containing protein [Roseofilum sp. SBFL]